MTLRLKISTQIDEENFQRNCDMLKTVLSGRSYSTAARQHGVSSLTATCAVKTLIPLLGLYCSEMEYDTPYTREIYPHLWKEVSMRGVNMWVLQYDRMSVDDIRSHPVHWLHMLQNYMAWKKTPYLPMILKESDLVSFLDLSTKTFRNIAVCLAEIVAEREPTIKELVDFMSTNPFWSEKWRDNTGLSKRAHNEIKRELVKHGFTLKDTKPVTDLELMRRSLNYLRKPGDYTRAERIALERLLEHRLATPSSTDYKA